jgi:hypothetical protein
MLALKRRSVSSAKVVNGVLDALERNRGFIDRIEIILEMLQAGTVFIQEHREDYSSALLAEASTAPSFTRQTSPPKIAESAWATKLG